MDCRYVMLQEAVAGYNLTGIPLVAFDGMSLKPAAVTDDNGIYYFLPILSKFLGTDLDTAITVFSLFFVFFFFVISALGFIRLFSVCFCRIIALLTLFMFSLYSLHLGNFSFVCSAGILALVPWGLYFLKEREGKIDWKMVLFLLSAGSYINLANFLRIHAGTPILVFLLVMIAGAFRFKNIQKVFLSVILICVVLLGYLQFQRIIDRRDMFLSVHTQRSAVKSGQDVIPSHHPIWHSIFVGFGYLNNEYGIVYDDGCAISLVKKIRPDVVYVSKEYESVLRTLVMRIMQRDPFFVLSTLFAKGGHIVLYFFLFANVGLIFIFRFPLEKQVIAAFVPALLFSALNGLLVMPFAYYLLGFCTFAYLYGLLEVHQFFNMRRNIKL